MNRLIIVLVTVACVVDAFGQVILQRRRGTAAESACSTSLLADGSDTLLEGWEGDGTEQTWTEAGTTGRLTFGADSSALTSGKVSGLCDKALRFDNAAGSASENWARWDNGSLIDVDTQSVDVVFYIYVVTAVDAGETVYVFAANPTTTFTASAGVAISMGFDGASPVLTGRGSTTATGALSSGWNKVKLHIDTATTGTTSYIQINGGSTLGFNRSTGGEDIQYFNFGAGTQLDAVDVCEYWIDGVQINTP